MLRDLIVSRLMLTGLLIAAVTERRGAATTPVRKCFGAGRHRIVRQHWCRFLGFILRTDPATATIVVEAAQGEEILLVVVVQPHRMSS
jgi:hypothetical protein